MIKDEAINNAKTTRRNRIETSPNSMEFNVNVEGKIVIDDMSINLSKSTVKKVVKVVYIKIHFISSDNLGANLK